MRLMKEKMSLKLQIISLIFLFVSTVMIQIADYQISKHNGLIVAKMLMLLNLYQIRSDHKSNANFYTIYQVLPFESIQIDKDIFSSQYVDQQSKNLFDELQRGSINIKDFIEKQIVYNKRKSKELLNEYNDKTINFNEFVKRGTKWKPIRNFVLIPTQIFFLCILVVGYSQLYIQISQRGSKE